MQVQLHHLVDEDIEEISLVLGYCQGDQCSKFLLPQHQKAQTLLESSMD